jgi:hypothetical protein
MRTMEGLFRARTRRRPPDFAPSSETPAGYVGQAVLDGFGGARLQNATSRRRILSRQFALSNT